jgi:hypothetical protein
MEDEVAAQLFRRFSKPGEKLDDDWVEAMEETIGDEGTIVAMKSWDSGGPGVGAGVDLIYRFRGVFLASSDFGLDGPFENLDEAAEAINLLAPNDTTVSTGLPKSPQRSHAKVANVNTDFDQASIKPNIGGRSV